MRREIMFAGFGGQGIVKAALLLTQAAGLFQDREVCQTQSYGPEARGGACRSEVIISDEEIAYIKTTRIDAFVVMSQPALEKYGDRVDPGRTAVIADATMIPQAPEGLDNYYPVEATRIAEQELGRALFANIVMLGALVAVTGVVSAGALEKSIRENVPAKTIQQNLTALRRGLEIGKGLTGA